MEMYLDIDPCQRISNRAFQIEKWCETGTFLGGCVSNVIFRAHFKKNDVF